MSEDENLIEIPSFELDLGDDAELSAPSLAEETNPTPPEPLLPEPRPAPQVQSKGSALDKMEPTDRKYVHAKAGMPASVRPYFGHTWRP